MTTTTQPKLFDERDAPPVSECCGASLRPVTTDVYRCRQCGDWCDADGVPRFEPTTKRSRRAR